MMKEPIDSRQLLVFSALAQKGSLRAAAGELHLTSSAISHSVHNLEENLGIKLFDRSGKHLVLNELGHYLLKETNQLLAHMAQIRTRLSENQLYDQASLRVAVGYNFVTHLLPEIVRDWNQAFPQAVLNVRAAERETCLGLLRAKEIDAAILVDAPEDESLAAQPLFEDELKVITGRSHPFAQLETVPLRSLQDKELLVSRLQSYTMRSVLSEMQRQGVSFKTCIEVGSTEAILEMIKVGMGIALQPDWVAARAGNPDLVSRPIKNTRFVRRWSYVRPKQAAPTQPDRTLCDLCRSACERLSTSRTGMKVC